MRQIVVGASTMGSGIAHTAAASGFDVTLIDVAETFLERGMSAIATNLQRGVDKARYRGGQTAGPRADPPDQ
jgi:3-hydroxybutyryl-CoA dehydrogenase